MSDLAKHFAKAKLSSLPPPEPLPEELPEYEDDSSSASSMSSTGTVMPTNTQRPAPAIHWSDYFAQELYLKQSRPGEGHAKFHVYVTPPASSRAPLLVLHHGAGSSAMSFALMAKEVKKAMPELGILAIEARDHGSVVFGADGNIDTNLSVDVLSQDLVDMLLLTQEKLGWPELPAIVLIGHSLGGAVVTHTANTSLLGRNRDTATYADVPRLATEVVSVPTVGRRVAHTIANNSQSTIGESKRAEPIAADK
jgi:protein phosphatase methylesterase 1